jgi:hypothetical protein
MHSELTPPLPGIYPTKISLICQISFAIVLTSIFSLMFYQLSSIWEGCVQSYQRLPKSSILRYCLPAIVSHSILLLGSIEFTSVLEFRRPFCSVIPCCDTERNGENAKEKECTIDLNNDTRREVNIRQET